MRTLLELFLILFWGAALTAVLALCLLTLPIVILFSTVVDLVVYYQGYLDRIRCKISEHRDDQIHPYLKRTLVKYLEIECSKQSKVPNYLVNAYLYLSKDSIYEVDKRTNTVTRVFRFNDKKNCIEVLYSHGSRFRIWGKMVSDLHDDGKEYYNHLPPNVTKKDD